MDDYCSEDKPPSNKIDMGSSTRFLSANGSLARRPSGWRAFLMGFSSFCSPRSSLHSRCYIVFPTLQEEIKCYLK